MVLSNDSGTQLSVISVFFKAYIWHGLNFSSSTNISLDEYSLGSVKFWKEASKYGIPENRHINAQMNGYSHKFKLGKSVFKNNETYKDQNEETEGVCLD